MTKQKLLIFNTREKFHRNIQKMKERKLNKNARTERVNNKWKKQKKKERKL